MPKIVRSVRVVADLAEPLRRPSIRAEKGHDEFANTCSYVDTPLRGGCYTQYLDILLAHGQRGGNYIASTLHPRNRRSRTRAPSGREAARATATTAPSQFSRYIEPLSRDAATNRSPASAAQLSSPIMTPAHIWSRTPLICQSQAASSRCSGHQRTRLLGREIRREQHRFHSFLRHTGEMP